MKKVLFGFVLAVVVMAGGVLWFKPDLTYDWAPSLWAPHHKKVVRENMQVFFGCLQRDDIDACLRLTDPEQLRLHGSGGIKLRYQFLSGMVRLGRLSDQDLRIDDITVAPDGKSATVVFSLRVGGEWKPQTPAKWVRMDRNWFITF